MKERQHDGASSSARRSRAILAACGLTIASCSTDQLPNAATMTIFPDEQSIVVTENLGDDGRCTFVAENTVDLPIVISLRDAQGAPIGDAEISVYVDFAENTFRGYPALALYRDRNGNGVIDDESELVSGIDDEIARVETSEYGGSSALLLRVNLSCAYRGRVFAFTEGVAASAAIEIVGDDDGERSPEVTTEDEFEEAPDEPLTPAEPVNPMEPLEPTDPENPTDPVDLEDPTDLANPVDPGAPDFTPEREDS